MIEKQTLVEFRHELHRFPELSNAEFNTAAKIVAKVRSYSPDAIYQGIGGTGVAFVFNGSHAGPTTLFRCELDALPINESNEFNYRSKFKGISHQCGHDGHMAIIVKLAEKISSRTIKRGRVVLMFQPAEETGRGAMQVVADNNFKSLMPDYAFALHNLPGSALGEVFVKPGNFNCASRGIKIVLSGKTSHAAHPEDGISPSMALAEVIIQLQSITNKLCEFGLITIVAAQLGELDEDANAAFGTTPGIAFAMATLRTRSNEAMNDLVIMVKDCVESIASKHQLSITIIWQDVFYACNNTKSGFEAITTACNNLNIPCTKLETGYLWSEDFGKFLETAKEGAMFALGSGVDCPQLHNPDYDFPDQLIDVGSRIFFELIKSINDFD